MSDVTSAWRSAHGPSLLDEAMILQTQYEDVLLSPALRPLPANTARRQRSAQTMSRDDGRAAVQDVLDTSDPGAPDILHERLCELDLPLGHFAGATYSPGAARELGVWLARNGTDRRPVMVGLSLLRGSATAGDSAMIRTIGLIPSFGPAAVDLLVSLPGTSSDLIWLAERSVRRPRRQAIVALLTSHDAEAVAWLSRHAVDQSDLSASGVRKVAEVVALADALDAGDVDYDVVDHAGRLLLAIAEPTDYRMQLDKYVDARRVFVRVAARFRRLAPSLARYATAVSLIEDLRTGQAACLTWNPGQLADVVEQFSAVLRRPEWIDLIQSATTSPDPAITWRASWALRDRNDVDPTDRLPDRQHFDIRIFVPDPLSTRGVETRILVNGRPVVTEAFDKGEPFAPEHLLDRSRLRAETEPREVRLAEAWCTEGCCGALYVTIVRDGDDVIWRDWRGHTSATPPAELRFAATQYDRELARAHADRSWEWPARMTARLLNERLRTQHDLPDRWQAHPCLAGARPDERDQLRFSFFYPNKPDHGRKTPWLQFERVIPIQRDAVTDQVDRIIRDLVDTDPKAGARIVGGSREYAKQLGFEWPM